MAGVNKVILLGNLGKDPEVRTLESGAKVASFTLATSETYKDRTTGQPITNTEWHNIVMWRGLADVAEKFLKKGSQIYIEGKIKTRNYQDKENNTRYITEIEASDLTMLGRPAGNSSEQTETSVPKAQPKSEKVMSNEDFSDKEEDDDLPF
jgi:single-strand DNA-binding protein